jgi:hypothetical protein
MLRISEPSQKEVTVGRRKVQNDQLHNLYNYSCMMDSRRVGLARNEIPVERSEMYVTQQPANQREDTKLES